MQVAQQLSNHVASRGVSLSQFSLAWCLANPILSSIIIGPRTIEQFEDNVQCLDIEITEEDERVVDELVPSGEHSGKGFQDTAYPITGRGR